MRRPRVHPKVKKGIMAFAAGLGICILLNAMCGIVVKVIG